MNKYDPLDINGMFEMLNKLERKKQIEEGNKMIIHIYEDRGHAWAKVKRTLLQRLKLEAHVSPYSYQKGDYVYLEEDVDLGLLVNALNRQGIGYIFKEHYTDGRSRVRSFDQFQPRG